MSENMTRDFDAVIVGGGITGLAAAAALGESGGRSVAILEARDLPPDAEIQGDAPADYDARVSALTLRSADFLERLGAWDAIAGKRTGPYSHMTVWDAEGTGRIDFDAEEVSARTLGSIVENRLITSALAQRVRAIANIQVFAPSRLMGLERKGGFSTLKLETGEQLSTGLLVAADGGMSPTRDLLGLRTREWDYGHRAIVSTVAFEESHAATAWQRFLQTGPLALLPLGGGDERNCSIVWSIDESEADAMLALEDAQFLQALGEASEFTLGRAVQCSRRFSFPLRQRHAIDYVCEGAALVGDAAHTIHPLAGQGVNLGLADVEVLVEEVLTAWKRGTDPGTLSVLKRYQRQRKGENLAMMAAMDGFKRLFEQQAPGIRWLRNAGMRGVGSIAPLKRQIIRQAMGVA
ncbi:MAG: UbiH/UbiF/VisC/COQ6 family ubiquinone biosynthesis hydroxylase [Pseudomonadota bacterium]